MSLTSLVTLNEPLLCPYVLISELEEPFLPSFLPRTVLNLKVGEHIESSRALCWLPQGEGPVFCSVTHPLSWHWRSPVRHAVRVRDPWGQTSNVSGPSFLTDLSWASWITVL